MTKEQAIERCKEDVKQYHILRYSNESLKESMRILTKAYEEMWNFLEKEYPDILDKFLERR